jgi:hypothetical protein
MEELVLDSSTEWRAPEDFHRFYVEESFRSRMSAEFLRLLNSAEGQQKLAMAASAHIQNAMRVPSNFYQGPLGLPYAPPTHASSHQAGGSDQVLTLKVHAPSGSLVQTPMYSQLAEIAEKGAMGRSVLCNGDALLRTLYGVEVRSWAAPENFHREHAMWEEWNRCHRTHTWPREELGAWLRWLSCEQPGTWPDTVRQTGQPPKTSTDGT